MPDPTDITVTARVRFTFTAEAVVTTTGTGEDEYVAEDVAYDEAARLIKERLEQIAVPNAHGVSVHGDIDGMEADVQVEEVRRS